MVSFDSVDIFHQTPPTANAVVYKADDKVIAKVYRPEFDRWDIIAEGTAGIDDAKVIQSAINQCGRILIKKGEYIIEASDEEGTDRAVGLYIPDDGSVEIQGEEKTSTILKLKYNGTRPRVDFISNNANVVSNPQIDGVKISNLTLDGSLIDWYDWESGTGKYRYGECIRFGLSKRYFTNLIIKDLIIKNFNVGWGIGIGYTPEDNKHSHIIIENIIGENLGRGVVWIAMCNYAKINNIYGKNITGNNPDGEGYVLSQESGLFAEIEGIRGEEVKYAIVNLSSTLRCSVRGIKGIINDNGYLVKLVNASDIQITDVNGYSKIENSGYGIYITNTNQDSYTIELNQIILYGTWCIYVDENKYTVNNLYITNLWSNKPAKFVNTNNITILGGRIYTGGADIILDNCSKVLLEFDYSGLSKVGTVTFRKNYGIATINANGTTTTFTIPHELVSTPKYVNVIPKGNAPKPDSIDWDATNITITFNKAPTAGTYYYAWEARI